MLQSFKLLLLQATGVFVFFPATFCLLWDMQSKDYVFVMFFLCV